MTTAREEILRRIRAATAGVPAEEPAAWDPDADDDPAAAYHRAPPQPPGAGALVARFAERVAEYRAEVTTADRDVVADAVAGVLARHGAARIAVPDGLPPEWLPAGLDVLPEADADVHALDRADGALTGCAAAIAETGTIVLDGGPAQGPRRLTLLPDLHVCVVTADRLHATVPSALRALEDSVRAGRPLTLISGPSATSDIELSRVEGVHGPRRLEVVVVGHGRDLS